MSQRSQLVAHFPSHEISVYQGHDGLAVDYPDIVDQGLAEEAANFVAHLMEANPEWLEKVQATRAWGRLDAVFVKWCLRRGLR